MAIVQDLKETPLCKLAYKYGTDKCPKIRHGYTPFYYKLFNPKRQKIKKVLEIGIGYKREKGKQYEGWLHGASLRMWRDFFPNAMIYGVDIREEAMFNDKRIRSFICDQNNEKDLLNLLDKIGRDIDIIIDDGSHIHQHQVFSARILRPLIPRESDYIIEDVTYCNTVKRRLGQFDCEVYKCPLLGVPITIHNDRLVVVKMK